MKIPNMAELVNQSQDATQLKDAPGVQKNLRCRFGQMRAPKRSMVDCKCGQRVHRTQKTEVVQSNGTSSTGETSLKLQSGHTAVPHPPDPLDLSPIASPNTEPHSPGVLPSVTTEHKRPRPEVQLDNPTGLSSAAPACCIKPKSYPPSLIEPCRSDLFVRDRWRQFVCKQSLVDEKRLQYLLTKESHYHPNNAFLYYVDSEMEDKVDAVLRNEAVHNLRFMHNAFFNLSTEAFCKAVNLIDRFIVKVKVKPKYMACVATASYCVANKLCYQNKEAELPDLDTVVHITRCGGNAADLLRMEEILASKLSHDLNGVNVYDFLLVFTQSVVVGVEDATFISDQCASDQTSITCNTGDPHAHGQNVQPLQTTGSCKNSSGTKVQRTQLIKRLMARLEVALCSLEVYRFRPACLALGILAYTNVKGLLPLASMCQVDWTDVMSCAAVVEELYDIYYRDPSPCNRRPLVWTLSRRTLCRIGYSSPTPLDTITEDCEPADEDEWLLPLLFEP